MKSANFERFGVRKFTTNCRDSELSPTFSGPECLYVTELTRIRNKSNGLFKIVLKTPKYLKIGPNSDPKRSESKNGLFSFGIQKAQLIWKALTAS